MTKNFQEKITPSLSSEKSIELIKSQISKIDHLLTLNNDDPEIDKWDNMTDQILIKSFGKPHENQDLFHAARFGAFSMGASEYELQQNYISARNKIRKLLEGFVEQLELFGEPTSRAEDKPTEGNIIFGNDLIEKLPSDISDLCNEFNFNFKNKKPNAGMLLLRKILPLSIVRKFQQMNKEEEVKIGDDYFDTKALLGKLEGYLHEKRIYNEINNYKVLVDSSQHSYTVKIDMNDTEGAAIKIRILLQDIFHSNE